MVKSGYFKGSDIVIEVLNRINDKVPIHACLVGSSSIVEHYTKRGLVHFPYTLYEDVNDRELSILYSSADLFLFTSRVEGFGLPPLESMACGTPVVTTDCSGNMDYAANGHNCIVSSSQNLCELSELSLKVLRNEELKKRIVAGGIETSARFTWDRTCDEFEKAFQYSLQ
jgi:glycosyltransferase involved in cell wall biosynthesis